MVGGPSAHWLSFSNQPQGSPSVEETMIQKIAAAVQGSEGSSGSDGDFESDAADSDEYAFS